jgi:arylformamidase
VREGDYPAQEPLSDRAMPYRDEVIARSFGVAFQEFRYGDDPYQTVAVYPAELPNGLMLAFAHGGGWTSGYKEWMGFMAPAFAERGIVFASIGYRLAPAHTFPTGVDDVAASVAMLCRAAKQFGADASRIFIGGHSAGGHYTSLLAVRRDWQQQYGLPADVIMGCLPISGVYRFGPDSGLAMKPRFLGTGEAVEREASPIYRIQAAPPPFLIAYGENDFAHLIRQAEQMSLALRNAGGDAESIILTGCDHFAANLAAGDSNGLWVSRAAAWMAKVSKAAAS